MTPASAYRNLDASWLVCVTAHGSGCRRWWPIAVESRILSRRFPIDSIHRVQRRSRYVPLFRQQAELLAGNHRRCGPVRNASEPDVEGWKFKNKSQSLSSLHQEYISQAASRSHTCDPAGPSHFYRNYVWECKRSARLQYSCACVHLLTPKHYLIVGNKQ